MVLSYCCASYRRARLVVSDAARLSHIEPRHCVVLQSHEPLRTRVKQLCKERFSSGPNTLNVINVAIVTNAAMRQRYEQVYQLSRLVRPQIASGRFANVVPSAGFGKIATTFESGVLRRGEMYMFCYVNEARIRATLNPGTLPSYVMNFAGGFQVMDSIKLSEFSSHIHQSTPGFDTRRMGADLLCSTYDSYCHCGLELLLC